MSQHSPDLSRLFHALCDLTGRPMQAQPDRGVLLVSDFARQTGLALLTIPRHLAVSEAADPIVMKKEGCIRYCRAGPDALSSADCWMDAPQCHGDAGEDRLGMFLGLLEKTDAAQSRN